MKAMPAWMYGSPLDIIDGQRALAAREARKATVEPVREKDRYYTQSRSIEIKDLVKKVKKYGGSKWK